MSEDTRETIRRKYSGSSDRYDEIRLKNTSGSILSNHDLHLFNSMLPEPAACSPALEIGAGTGRFTIPALERGFEIVATDVNEGLLSGLRGKIEERGWSGRCRVRLEDVFHLSLADASMGFAFAIHVLPRFLTLTDQRMSILEVGRVLRPGGRFLFNFRNRMSLIYGLLDKEHAATAQEIQEVLHSAGMRIIRMRGKWFVSGSLIRRLPDALSHTAVALDRMFWDFAPHRAFDVFVLAEKRM